MQLKILEKFLNNEFLQVSKFVKGVEESGVSTKSWVWQSIYVLEELNLIERVNQEEHQKKNVIYKCLFTKEILREKYMIEFLRYSDD